MSRFICFMIWASAAAAHADSTAQGPDAGGRAGAVEQQVAEPEAAQDAAFLSLTSNVPAQIMIDGVDVGETPMETPLTVAAGRVALVFLAPGYESVYRALTLAAQERRTIHAELEPSSRGPAELLLRCALPGVEVWVDGELAGRTPLDAPLSLAPGERHVELRRNGYHTAERRPVLAAGATTELELVLEADPDAPGGGRLHIDVNERDAHIFIDGTQRHRPSWTWPLPAGRHHVKVERYGFIPSEHVVEVRPGERTVLSVELTPTRRVRNDREAGIQTRELAGWVSLIGGGLLFVGSGTWWLLNENAVEDAEQRQTDAIAQFAGGPPCGAGSDMSSILFANCVSELRAAEDNLDNHQTLGTISLVGTGLGMAGIAVGVVLLLTADDTGAYAQPNDRSIDPFPEPWEITSKLEHGPESVRRRRSF